MHPYNIVLATRCFEKGMTTPGTKNKDAGVQRARTKVYTVRFAIGMLMQHFLDARFNPKYADMVAAVRSEEYYINMMIAWFFATALAKQYASILPYMEGWKLDDWTHNKAIQKSVEKVKWN